MEEGDEDEDEEEEEEEEFEEEVDAHVIAGGAPQGTPFTCFTGTGVQILPPAALARTS